MTRAESLFRIDQEQVFLRKMLGTRYGSVETRFLWFLGPDFLWF